MMRIAFVAHSAKKSGAELSMVRLAAAMHRSHVRIFLLEDGPLRGVCERRGLDVTVLPSDTRKLQRNSRSVAAVSQAVLELCRVGIELKKHLQLWNADVVIARSPKSLLCALPSKRFLPIVWSVHDQISAEYFGKAGYVLLKTLGRLMPNAYIANSKSTLQTVPRGRKSAIVLPPGLELENFHCDPNITRNRDNRLRIVMVGRIAEWKGQMIFLQSLLRAFPDGDYEAKIVGEALFGEDDYKGQLTSFINDNAMSECVRLCGHIDDVPRVLMESDVAVHASILPEPFGAVVIEAMAARCAVIATRPGGPAEVISDGLDGILVDGGSVEQLSEAMVRLKASSDLRTRLVTAGSKTAQQYDVKDIASNLEHWLPTLTGPRVTIK